MRFRGSPRLRDAGSPSRHDGAALASIWRAEALTWSVRLALFDLRSRVWRGVIPFFIDWGDSPHPADSAAQGATLVDLRVEHPDVDKIRRMLGALDLDVDVVAAEKPAIVTAIEGPRGRVELR